MPPFLGSTGKKAITAFWFIFIYSIKTFDRYVCGPATKVTFKHRQIINLIYQAVFSVAQCIFYNSTFRHRKQATGTYHNTMREPPLPIYVGLLLHGEISKRSLVDEFFDLGLSVSYDRVLSISADLGNDISKLYKSEGVVCPRQLRHRVFTAAAYDNIDHNPSSNTALGALHGTAISLFQHPCHTNPGVARIIESHVVSLRKAPLQEEYTNVPPLVLPKNKHKVPQTNSALISQSDQAVSAMQKKHRYLRGNTIFPALCLYVGTLLIISGYPYVLNICFRWLDQVH